MRCKFKFYENNITAVFTCFSKYRIEKFLNIQKHNVVQLNE